MSSGFARALACLLAICLSFSMRARCYAEGGVIDMGGMSDERARSHFKVGKTLYEAGRFPEAATEWEQAYALSKKGAILYNLYVAYRDAGDLPKATDALRRYLATDEVSSDIRVNLEARLRALEESNSRAAAASQPAPQPSAAATPAPASAPERASEVTAPPASTPPSAAARSEPQAATNVWPFVFFVAGGALIATSVATGIVASNKISDIEKHCPGGTCPASFMLDSQRSDARTFRTLTLVLGGVGIAAAAAGAVLLLLPAAAHADARAGERTPSASVACMPGGCFGALRTRF